MTMARGRGVILAHKLWKLYIVNNRPDFEECQIFT